MYTYIHTYVHCILCHFCGDKPDNICILESPPESKESWCLGLLRLSLLLLFLGFLLVLQTAFTWIEQKQCKVAKCPSLKMTELSLQKSSQESEWSRSLWSAETIRKIQNLYAKAPESPGSALSEGASDGLDYNSFTPSAHIMDAKRRNCLISWLAGTQQYHAISSNTQWGNWNDCFWEVPQWASHALVSQI